MARQSKSKALTTARGKLSQRVERDLNREKQSGGTYISTEGGKFSYNGDELPQPLDVVILDYTFVKAYYDRPFVAGEVSPPACFAINFVEEDMVPHENSPVPVCAEGCEECEFNEFGSDLRGRGKKCRDLRRLAVIPADDLSRINTESEVAFLNLPPGSLKAFRGYSKKVLRTTNMPLAGSITTLNCETGEGGGHIITFEFGGEIQEDVVLEAVNTLIEATEEDLMVPYDCADYEPPSEKKPRDRAAKATGGATRKTTAKKTAAKKRTSRR